MERATDHLEVLLDLTRKLAEERPLEEALTAITDAALRLLSPTHASIRLLDDSRSELIAGARSGAGVGERPLTFRPGEGILGWVVEHGVIARVDDAHIDPRFLERSDQGFEVISLLVVPLWSGAEVIGVIGMTSDRPAAFSSEDEILARLLANCTIPPIERARLRRLAMFDHQTDALGARFFLSRLEEEIARARQFVSPLSLLILDLDDFKQVNDTHGHPVGDQVLRGFADRVREQIRARDVFVRRGGDEFALIMPAAGAEAAATVAARISRDLQWRPIEVGEDLSIRQTVSIGCATWNRLEDAQALELRTDRALYAAKGLGRNRVSLG